MKTASVFTSVGLLAMALLAGLPSATATGICLPPITENEEAAPNINEILNFVICLFPDSELSLRAVFDVDADDSACEIALSEDCSSDVRNTGTSAVTSCSSPVSIICATAIAYVEGHKRSWSPDYANEICGGGGSTGSPDESGTANYRCEYLPAGACAFGANSGCGLADGDRHYFTNCGSTWGHGDAKGTRTGLTASRDHSVTLPCY